MRKIYKLNESSYDVTDGNEDFIASLGEVDVYDRRKKQTVKVNAIDVIKVCNDAVYKINRDYPYLYTFMSKCKIMYIPVCPSEITDTMAVDGNNNLWINFDFVYNDCLMDSNRVFGILFHELFHIFFEHILRFNRLYPENLYGNSEILRRANQKANICMDYEVNASMVEDGIVAEDFFKKMNCLYNKKYTGKTWEDIMNEFGDIEYKEWLKRNGFSLDDIELKVLDAIEKAAKVLMDPNADDEEKKYARRELKKTLDKLLGKTSDGEKTLQDELEELQNSKLGDIGNLAMDLDDLISDLDKDIEGMTDEDLSNALSNVDKLMDDMSKESDEIGKQFGKDAKDVYSDVEKSRKSLKETLDKIKNDKSLSKEEKKNLLDNAMDDLEDIISNDAEKEKRKKKRDERNRLAEEKIKETLKKNHPVRKLIVVMSNLADLYNVGLVSKKTVDILNTNIEDLDKLTEKRFREFKKSDLKDLSKHLDELKESLLPDLVELIKNKTILNKTEDDMKRLVDGVFEHIFNAFRHSVDPKLDDNAKGSVMKMAAQKLRIIGKVLKTQKVWKVTDDFKSEYIKEMKRLSDMIKDGKEDEVFKELYNNGAINIGALDQNGFDIYNRLINKGEIKRK